MLIFWSFPRQTLPFCLQSTADAGISRTSSSQIQEQESVNHPSSPTEDTLFCGNDVIARHQVKGER